VVSTATGDIAALVRDGTTGLVVPPRDPGAVAGAVTALLGDPDRARRLARAARDAVDAYRWPRVSAEWTAIYAEAPA
jgi:glycosyltransferase involved in cell wall biosynthesis